MAQKDRDHIRRLREEANAIRKQEQAKRRRNRILAQVGIIGGALVVIVAVVGLVIFGPQWFNPRPDFQAAGTVEVADSAGEAVEQPISTTERGILVGATDAPVTIQYWYDYSCPHCIDYHAQTNGIYQDLIASGQVQVEYIPINYVAPYGAQAGAAVLAAVQHQPELYFTISDALFSVPAEQQQSWGTGDYASIAPTLGVTDEQALADINEGTYLRIVNDSTRDARADGVEGTPSIGVNGTIQAEIPVGEDIYALVNANGGDVTPPTTGGEPATESDGAPAA
ncbi:thiol-disulfide oxidoreductase [Pseudoclavibacter endophyticus]|uniref:Thioredoxin domain-containing protein n=1 Tax=Pseudoclavibacter endophyticus TaxID=1778590 RepID=A0A6H9WIY8_9MICO|nr:thioredoxin domain-containing protein [Pseudoclavibacter endophyticus]KAB1649203.1 thioredoxin domain-containing protein [Pseudoclavibacter endophyticus]GGA64561.1 thiol-disulfide oxidoreductase [Pseudoclavibacter endophyticus]